jgi:large subunit ribosomal protein L10
MEKIKTKAKTKAKTEKKKEKTKNGREVPEKKQKLLQDIVNMINKHNTVMIALIENLSSMQFQKLKKTLAEKVMIKVIKKTLVLRALEKAKVDKKGIELLEKSLESNFAIVFSNLDPFELAAILSENKTHSYAKPGYIAKEDLIIEPGPTDLPAGPVISELSNANIKASIESGKIVIRERCVVAKAGGAVSAEAVNVLMKLEIKPVVISLQPVAAYDSKNSRVYENIKVDKEETINQLSETATKSLGFALHLEYITKETINFLLIKANSHFNTLKNKLPQEEKKEKKEEEPKGKEEKEKEEQKEKKVDAQTQENKNSEENK